MKRIILLVLLAIVLLLIAGCSDSERIRYDLTSEQINQAIDACNRNDGVSLYRFTKTSFRNSGSRGWTTVNWVSSVTCNDGAIFNNPGDLNQSRNK